MSRTRRWLFKCELYQTERDEWLVLPVYVSDQMNTNTRTGD